MARVWRPLERPVALLVMGWSQERSATALAIRFAFHALPLVLVVIGSPASPVRGDDSRFRAVAPGVAHTTFKLQSDNGEPFSGHAFKIDLGVAKLHVVSAGDPSSRRTVEEIAAPYPAVVAANASFFDKDGRAMGLAVDEGRVIVASRQASWGVLVVDGKKARIGLGSDIRDPRAYRLIVQGIPRLVVAGKVQRLKRQVAERTAVCAAGRVVVLVVATRTTTLPAAHTAVRSATWRFRRWTFPATTRRGMPWTMSRCARGSRMSLPSPIRAFLPSTTRTPQLACLLATMTRPSSTARPIARPSLSKKLALAATTAG